MTGKKIVLSLSIFVLTHLLTTNTFAQSRNNVQFHLSGDIVSSYVWRGFKQAGASVQPSLSMNVENLTIGSWASTDISSNGKKEVDFYANYNLKKIELTVTDYWWDGENTFRYLSSPNDNYSGHLLEAGIKYTFSENIPLTVAYHTFLLGKANKKVNGRNGFSTYIELSYPFQVNDIGLCLTAGFIPWNSPVYGHEMDSFKFNVIQFSASKEIKISNPFNVPIYTNIILNPAQEDIHFVFGLTLK